MLLALPACPHRSLSLLDNLLLNGGDRHVRPLVCYFISIFTTSISLSFSLLTRYTLHQVPVSVGQLPGDTTVPEQARAYIPLLPSLIDMLLLHCICQHCLLPRLHVACLLSLCDLLSARARIH